MATNKDSLAALRALRAKAARPGGAAMSHQANDAYMAEFEMAMEEMGISDGSSMGVAGAGRGGAGGVAGRARGAIGGGSGGMGGSPAGGGRLAAGAGAGSGAGGAGGRVPPAEGRYPPSVTQQWAHGPRNPEGEGGHAHPHP